MLTDEHGYDVRLKKGAHVEVTVTAEPKTSTAAIDEEANRRGVRQLAGDLVAIIHRVPSAYPYVNR